MAVWMAGLREKVKVWMKADLKVVKMVPKMERCLVEKTVAYLAGWKDYMSADR